MQANDQSGGGLQVGGQTGQLGATGDFNGDGYADIIIGAPIADRNGLSDIGEAYVVFGGPTLGASGAVQLSALNGNSGFKIVGIGDTSTTGDAFTGASVANAGDINNDGFDDIVVGASRRAGDENSDDGYAYVIYGAANFAATVDLATLDVGSGRVLTAGPNFVGAEQFGYAVAGIGDFTGDGIDDLAVGAPTDRTNGSNGTNGRVWVFAEGGENSRSFEGTLNASIGSGVAGAGDFNGDGTPDIVIGAWTDSGFASQSGAAYVVYGGGAAQGELDELGASAGMIIYSTTPSQRLGQSVASAGDVNGDGLGDVIIGALNGDSAYIVFGRADGIASIDIASLDGTNGFRLTDTAPSIDFFGTAVGGGGDFNGDGYDDIVIGARVDDSGSTNGGQVMVVFGGQDFGASLDTSEIDGRNGILINGDIAGQIQMGTSVAFGGDVNGDGFDDIVIGAPGASPNGNFSGQTYVILGGNFQANVNNKPQAVSDGYSLVEDGALVVAAAGGVLANDTDANGDALTAVLVNGPAHGGLTFAADGSFNYTPDADFNGTDRFSYRASDGRVAGNSVQVTLTVAPANDAPAGAADRYGLNAGQTLSVAAAAGVLANDRDIDGDALSAALVAGTANGTLNLASDGSFTYTANAGFTGQDSFVYVASDGSASTGNVIVTLDVFPNNLAPVAGDDIAATDEDSAIILSPLSNDSDPDGDPLTIVDVRVVAPDATSTQGLTAILSPDGQAITFDPTAGTFTQQLRAGQAQVVSIAYTISDGRGGFDTASITVTVDGRDEPGITLASLYTIAGIRAGTTPLDATTAVAQSTDTSLTSMWGVGDVNGDGIDDFAVDLGMTEYPLSGSVRVVYGDANGFDATLTPADVGRLPGFDIVGAVVALSGPATGAVDVNNDGYDDLLLANANADGGRGEAYVIFGGADQAGRAIDVATLNGATGFTVYGNQPGQGTTRGDNVGYSLAGLGDVNNDGIDDIAISSRVRGTLVMFGSESGFEGRYAFDGASAAPGLSIKHGPGARVSEAGDFDGDGFSDILVSDGHDSWLVFGSSATSGTVQTATLDGSNGLRFPASGNYLGLGQAGDVNGDGLYDLFFTSFDVGTMGDPGAGGAYVVFGTDAAMPTTFDFSTLDGSNGFALVGGHVDARVRQITSAGDLNGDGFDELLVVAAEDGRTIAGSVHVVFGREDGFAAAVDLDDLDGGDGFTIRGDFAAGEVLGYQIDPLGDVNADGYDDFALLGVSFTNGAVVASTLIYGDEWLVS
ncbi:MAG: Ig-like domain-containing protein [Hyphomicrobiaceae bacterium]